MMLWSDLMNDDDAPKETLYSNLCTFVKKSKLFCPRYLSRPLTFMKQVYWGLHCFIKLRTPLNATMLSGVLTVRTCLDAVSSTVADRIRHSRIEVREFVCDMLNYYLTWICWLMLCVQIGRDHRSNLATSAPKCLEAGPVTLSRSRPWWLSSELLLSSGC